MLKIWMELGWRDLIVNRRKLEGVIGTIET